MKRFLSVLMVLALVLGCVSAALAEGPRITKQPETKEVKKGGKISYTVRAQNTSGLGITWYFTEPGTGKVFTGKTISSHIKGLRVINPNSLSITLRNVPAEMHGYELYCHIGSRSGGVNSQTVTVLIKGMDAPVKTSPKNSSSNDEDEDEGTSSRASSGDEDEGEDEDEGSSNVSKKTGTTSTTSKTGTTSTASKTGTSSTASKTGTTSEATQTKEPEEPAKPTPVTITAGKGIELYAIDRLGNLNGSAQATMTFPSGTANFYAKLPAGTEGSIQYLTVGSLRITPAGEVNGMSIRGVTTSGSVRVKVAKPGQAAAVEDEEPVDPSTLVTVKCTNCRFTGWHNTFVESGQVPAGSTITVIASNGLINKGYSINGDKAEHKDQATFRMVVDADTTITMELQK